MEGKVSILIRIALLLSILQLSNGVVFKMTNAVCESYNKSWVVFQKCRLHAVQRNKTILNIAATFLHPTNSITLRSQVLKKASGYKPWVIDVTVDACKFLKTGNSKVVGIIYNLFKEFSNINHSCPYVGQQILKGFYPRADKMPLVFPTGDYLLHSTWIFYGKPQFVTKVYFNYVEDFCIMCKN